MNQDLQKIITEVLDNLLKPLDENIKYDFINESTQWRINIQTQNELQIRGFRDQNLNSVQHILRVLVHKELPDDQTHFILDTNMSKMKKEMSLVEKIPAFVKEEVIKLGRPVAIIGLNGYERKLIHNALMDIRELETVSFGMKPNRRLVIRPTGETISNSSFDNARFITVEEIESMDIETKPHHE